MAEEPSVVLLPNGDLFVVVRTYTGHLWYSISEDNGHSWRPMEILRYSDGGDYIKQPRASAPLFAMTKEDFVLVFHNNEGKKNGYDQKWLEWPDNVLNYIRNPAFVSLGKYMPNAFQPIWFEAPTKFEYR